MFVSLTSNVFLCFSSTQHKIFSTGHSITSVLSTFEPIIITTTRNVWCDLIFVFPPLFITGTETCVRELTWKIPAVCVWVNIIQSEVILFYIKITLDYRQFGAQVYKCTLIEVLKWIWMEYRFVLISNKIFCYCGRMNMKGGWKNGSVSCFKQLYQISGWLRIDMCVSGSVPIYFKTQGRLLLFSWISLFILLVFLSSSYINAWYEGTFKRRLINIFFHFLLYFLFRYSDIQSSCSVTIKSTRVIKYRK